MEYVDPDRGRERRPQAAWWSARFERVSPVRGFCLIPGQRNWPGWLWFSHTGEHVGYESWVERDVLMALGRLPAEAVETALVRAAPDRGDHRGAARQPAGHRVG